LMRVRRGGTRAYFLVLVEEEEIEMLTCEVLFLFESLHPHARVQPAREAKKWEKSGVRVTRERSRACARGDGSRQV